MTDLGQAAATRNILLNETALQYFTQNFTTMQLSFIIAAPGPANDSYNALKYQTGPLNNSVAVISAKYLCQVPRQKFYGNAFRVYLSGRSCIYASALEDIQFLDSNLARTQRSQR